MENLENNGNRRKGKKEKNKENKKREEIDNRKEEGTTEIPDPAMLLKDSKTSNFQQISHKYLIKPLN